ncbi:MAG TPA: oxygenase MpaB family protein, partial [Anaerolineales bacterium]|nr:oxygenase MpaB family protein [Anaerolineales bacterium]
RSKIRLSPEQAEAYLHCWKVVGHIMGICPELMPENVEDAYQLANTIIARQRGESDSGKLLIRDLIEFMQSFMPRLFHGFPVTATRFLSGDKIANLIEVGPFDWTLAFLKLQIFLFDIAERLKYRFPGLQSYIRFLTWNLIDRVVIYEEGDQGTYFQIPDHLRKRWHLSRQQ